MSESATAAMPLEQAQALFADEELPFPPVPADMAAQLREVEPEFFSTRPEENGPYDIDSFSFEVQTEPAVSNYALIGFDGHGINSWAMHYYVVDDALALFVQLPWGGAYDDPEACRRVIATAFAWAEKLQTETKQAHERGLIPAGWRLLVVASTFREAGWAFVPSPPPVPDAIEWHAAGNLREEVDAALADVLAGRIKLG